MKPKRILHIMHTLNRGGLEGRIMDLYRTLDRDRFQYDFYVESGMPGAYDEEVRDLGGRIYKSQGRALYNIPDFKAFRVFLIDHPEYKMVCAYNQWAGLYLKQAKQCDVPYRIANARTSIQTRSFKNIVKNIVKKNVNYYATHRFAVSKKAAAWLFGCDNDNIIILPNAIDTNKFAFSEKIRASVRKELGLSDELTIIHVGNIRFEKNHQFLLKVFSGIHKKRQDARLLLVGGGNIETLTQQIKDLGIEDNVHYLGVRTDIERLLQAGDFFIFPSLYEGFPGAVLEAEASGLNCIISDSITDEVALTDHIRMLPLSAGPKSWMEAMDSFDVIDRSTAWLKIKHSGYDIEELKKRVELFYEKLYYAS